jgi:hypothetical protein
VVMDSSDGAVEEFEGSDLISGVDLNSLQTSSIVVSSSM